MNALNFSRICYVIVECCVYADEGKMNLIYFNTGETTVEILNRKIY